MSATASMTCASWCSEHRAFTLPPDEGVTRCTHQTSDPAAPYLVRAERWNDESPVVYVEDAHGDDLTATDARAFAAALVAAADLVEGVDGRLGARHLVAGEVRAALARDGRSASALASASGIPSSSLSRKLAGRVAFTVEAVVAVAVALGVDPGVLVDPDADQE